VIKERRLPLHARVAFGASSDVVFGKLLSVNVLVAVFTLGWRCLEVHVHQFGFEIGRLVAIDARSRAMRPEQSKLRLRVVEARQFLPRFRGVASFASRR